MAKRREFLNKQGDEALNECLRRIRELDPELKAWVEVNPQPPLLDGPLRGIGFAAKDIYETRGLATEYGSPIFAGRKGGADAELVTRLRNLGAILLGKTTTAAFAYFDPPATRNPRNRAHTPGGSSSGSAAAVAAGMAPFALGSQTGGSVIRPASYCGIAGFKPSFGTLPLEGVLPFAPSLDTAGLFTESAADMLDLWTRMGYTSDSAAVERLGVLPIAPGVETPMREALLDTADRLRTAGFQVERIEPPEGFSNLASDVALVMDYEGSRTNRQLWQTHGEAIGKKLAHLVARGLKLTQVQNEEALGRIQEAKRRMAETFTATPVILTPAAFGPAPPGLESTGSPALNAPWTGLGGPAVTIPMAVHRGLPLGLQMTSNGSNEALLRTAVAVEAAL